MLEPNRTVCITQFVCSAFSFRRLYNFKTLHTEDFQYTYIENLIMYSTRMLRLLPKKKLGGKDLPFKERYFSLIQ